ncbi:MAG: DUF2254 domain-containing protein [Pseudomonadota bacterium]|nr:DUF2254 domain-containing protein [Pseudomonadota bacterium]
MRFSFSKLAEAIRASYWFVPSVMAFLAILLGAGMVWLDAVVADGILDGIGWYQSVKPEGAHQVLSTIAGSMITVAGVVFSITIVAIAYAASQYGPRVLTNFMGDRGNQVTLGTFIATFVYCLVVLRTIRGGDPEFVPQLAVIVGIALALCSIGVLIFFIHHVPQTIHVNSLVAHIGGQLLSSLGHRFPRSIGDPADDEEQIEDDAAAAVAALEAGRGVVPVPAAATGYVKALDNDRLMSTARDRNLLVRLRYRPGDFVHTGRVLADAWPTENVGDGDVAALQASFAIGNKRTPAGDIDFLVDELAEIGGRALSSGVNDPYTAIICLDWLGAAASELATRRMPSPRRVDKDGTVRVIALADTFEGFIERGFGRLRPYVGRDVNASRHMLLTLRRIAEECRTADQLRALRNAIADLVATAQRELHQPSLDEVEAEAERARRFVEERQP